MTLSVVLTTYNNESTIDDSLGALVNQTIPESEFEIIVVSDGSSDNTNAKIQTFTRRHPTVQFISQRNLGVARARNVGMQRARGDVILFTQGDIIADPHLIERHMLFHDAHAGKNYALVGHTAWSPDLEITPFMDWLENGGPQFDFNRLKDGQKTDFLSFYTTNISLKRRFIQNNGGFDESFKVKSGVTAYEDTEFGYRLEQRGMRLFYDASATVFHKHPKTLADVTRRRYFEGRMAHRLKKKHPQLSWPRRLSDGQIVFLTWFWLNPLVMAPFTFLARKLERTKRTDRLFKLVCRAYYNWGYLVGYLI